MKGFIYIFVKSLSLTRGGMISSAQPISDASDVAMFNACSWVSEKLYKACEGVVAVVCDILDS